MARYARGGAALSAEQKLFGSWSSEALRLTWIGADWTSDGDLFVYLDTAAGGATQAYNPYTATAGTRISLPDGMGADYLVVGARCCGCPAAALERGAPGIS